MFAVIQRAGTNQMVVVNHQPPNPPPSGWFIPFVGTKAACDAYVARFGGPG